MRSSRTFVRHHLASQRGGAVASTPAVATAVALVACGAGLLVCAAYGGTDGWQGSTGLATTGAGALLLGLAGVKRYRVAKREAPAAAFAALLAALLTQVAVSTVAYLASGTFDRLDDALFESVAGFSTTALSVVPDPQLLPDGVALWRALTQWSGGLTALVAVATVVPALGVAGQAGGDTRSGPRHLPLASRQALGLLSRLFRLYGVLTVIGVAFYLAAGMGPFDAVTYALTTVSSGGMGHHVDSIAHFDSALIEWAAIGGMVLAGVNLAVVFRSARGLVSGSVLRSAELRAFLGIIVTFSAVVIATSGVDGDLHERVRQSVFSVVSMVSTTGLTVDDWGRWNDGAQVLLLLAAGIGAMSGAIGGGFRVARMLAVVAYVRREIVKQIHPEAIRVVKVGRRPVDEVLVDRIVGYQILYLFVGGLGAIILACTGASVITALSGAVSALSTAGPALGELGPSGGALGLPAPARLAMVPLMLLGRLELAPVLVGLGLLARRARAAPR